MDSFLALFLTVIPSGLNYESFHEFDGGRVWTATAKPDESPWIKAEAKISEPPAKVFELLTQFARYEEIFTEGVEKVTVLEQGDKTARLHVVWPMPFPFSDRDGIVRYTGKALANGSYLVEWQDAAKPTDPQTGERIERIAGQTTLSPLPDGSTSVTYVYYGELGGSLFDWMKRAAWRGQPELYFSAIEKSLKR